MKQVNEHIDDLIIQFLCGELDENSLAELRAWIAISPQNERYFHEKQEIWFSSVDAALLKKYNKQEAFRVFQERVAMAQEDKNIHLKDLFRWKKWTGYAAMLALICIMTFFAYHQGKHNVSSSFADIQVEAPMGSRTKALLPDGTIVWLNSGSKLTYSQGYGLNDRKVSMSGEGYFEVKHNEKLPFCVNSQNLRVNVLGTQFNFRDYPDDKEAEVILDKGSVKLDNLTNTGNSQLMVPGQKVILDKKSGKMITEECEINIVSQWTQGLITFDNATLDEIAKRIERSYNVTVHIRSKAVGKYRFNGDFVRQEQSLQEVLDALAATGHLHYQLKGRIVTIY